MAGANNRGGSTRSSGAGRGGVNLNPRRIGGAGSSTVLKDRNTAAVRRMVQNGQGRNERLMAATGRMSRSMMSTSNGRGLRRSVNGDFYMPGSAGARYAGNKFNGQATRKGNRVTVAEQTYPRNGGPAQFTGRNFRYRLSDRPGVRLQGAATVRRRIKR